MDTLSAFAINRASQGNERMVFDWEKAARIIAECGAKNASAGLAGDWENTGGEILRDGKPVPEDETYTYLASTWARPELEVDGKRVDCYRMESATPGWHHGTYWPGEAMDILGENMRVAKG